MCVCVCSRVHIRAHACARTGRNVTCVACLRASLSARKRFRACSCVRVRAVDLINKVEINLRDIINTVWLRWKNIASIFSKFVEFDCQKTSSVYLYRLSLFFPVGSTVSALFSEDLYSVARGKHILEQNRGTTLTGELPSHISTLTFLYLSLNSTHFRRSARTRGKKSLKEKSESLKEKSERKVGLNKRKTALEKLPCI